MTISTENREALKFLLEKKDNRSRPDPKKVAARIFFTGTIAAAGAAAVEVVQAAGPQQQISQCKNLLETIFILVTPKSSREHH